MLTSILLPIYNGSLYLEKAIRSIVSQQGDWELILQDDCSTDETEEICKKFISWKVHYFKNDTSLKCFGTLNNAALHAKGDLFRIFSHDDLMNDNDIIMSEKYMVENEDIGLCFTDYDMIDEFGKITGSSLDFTKRNSLLPEKMRGERLAVELFRWGCISGTQSNITVRKNIYKNIGGFNAGLLYTGDFFLLCEAGIKYGIGYNKVKTCSIRFHSQQLSKEGIKSRDKLLEMKIIIDYLLNNMSILERNKAMKSFISCFGSQLIISPLKQMIRGNLKDVLLFSRLFGIRNTLGSVIEIIRKSIFHEFHK